MIVYTESNFVLELALLQEQEPSCSELVKLAESQRIRLAIPAFSLSEPHETLFRRERDRRQLKQQLDRELLQLGRTTTRSDRLKEFAAIQCASPFRQQVRREEKFSGDAQQSIVYRKRCSAPRRR